MKERSNTIGATHSDAQRRTAARIGVSALADPARDRASATQDSDGRVSFGGPTP